MFKNIAKLLSSNIIHLFFGVLINFMLPAFLSYDSYAMLKTYIFYLSYASILSFGYIDGILIKAGGKSMSDIEDQFIYSSRILFFIIQLILCVVIFIIGVKLNNGLIVIFSIGVLTTNVVNYYKNLCVAVGEYNVFSFIVSFEKVAQFIFFIILVFILKVDNYYYYCFIYIFVSIISIIIFISSLNKYHYKTSNVDLNGFISIIQVGILFMFANFSFSLFSSLDRWFIKILLTNIDFALYSFAISMEQIIVAFMSPIASVLYNYICRGISAKEKCQYQRYLLIYGFLISLGAFVGKYLINILLPEYSASTNVILILFVSQVYQIIISAIYLNEYKAKNKSKEMIIEVFIMIIIGIVSNFIGYQFNHSLEIFALMTLITKMVWFILCMIKNNCLMKNNEVIYMLSLTILYIVISFKLDALAGVVVSVLIYCIFTAVLMNDDIKKLKLTICGKMKGALMKHD